MKQQLEIICIACLLTLLPFALKSQTPSEKLTQELNNTFQQTHIAGMSVAIVNPDKILYQKNFGYADLSTQKPYTERSIHNIGSTSKTFIGIALMQLVEQGKLTLDTEINELLPFEVKNPYHPDTPITLRQLATHTSSIRDRTFNYGLRAYRSTDQTPGNRKGLPLMYKVMFKRMLKNEAVSLGQFLENTLSETGNWYAKKNFYKEAPGSTENYSNIGASLAGYIVEIVSGESYDDYVKNHILKPLNMSSTAWSIKELDATLFAKRYVNQVAFPDYTLMSYPDGALISSAQDLTTYLQAMIRGYTGKSSLLSAASFQEMMSNQYEKAPLVNSLQKTEGRSGIFWDIFGKEGQGDIGHNGSDPGILTFMYFDPESGIGCLLFTNTDAEDKHMPEIIQLWEMLIKNRGQMEG